MLVYVYLTKLGYDVWCTECKQKKIKTNTEYKQNLKQCIPLPIQKWQIDSLIGDAY